LGKTKRLYDKHYKLIAVLLAIFAILLLLALISYTPDDESNINIKFSDLFKLFGNDEIISAKASTTQNWLGLTGAYIANFLYNGTFGYAIILLPVLVIAWSERLFTGGEIYKKLIQYTIIYFVIGTSFASLIGSLQHFQLLESIPKEWSGNIGKYLSNVTVSFIGTIGATSLYGLITLVALYYGTDINFNKYFSDFFKILVNIGGFLWKYLKKLFSILTEKSYESVEKVKETVKEQFAEEMKSKSEKEDYPTITRDDEHVEEIVETSNEDSLRKFRNKPTIQINLKDTEPIEIQGESPNPFNKLGLGDSSTQIKPKISEIPMPANETYTENEVHQESTNEKAEQKAEIPYEEHNLSETIVPTEAEKVYTSIDDDDYDWKKTNVADEVSNDDYEEPVKPYEKPTPAPNHDKRPVNVNLSFFEDDTEELGELISTSIHDEEINYHPPGIDLLNNTVIVSTVSEDELRMNAKILQEKLETFKIYIENLTVTPGPVVTQYEFVPAPGIKISKIESYADDLAMALKAKGIRIIAPIPGKGTVGVEIPNSNPSMVTFYDTFQNSRFQNTNFALPLVLGKTISGEVFIVDLAKMPHLLIAGSTGSGKSVGINTIISSLLYKKHPSELKFVMIDPKKVELQQYTRLKKHFLAMSPDIQDLIITKPEDAVNVLKSTVLEMEIRYDILASVGQKNIIDYNQKIRENKIKSTNEIKHRPMPYIVVIIDELADLMLTASKEIEEPITRLAQMARAVGIHLVLATQRPSVDVITGLIKANFPARIAYLVTSRIDSRTILDMQGAEKLLGMGDMLCLQPGKSQPIRVQNSFITTDEVENLCDFISNQKGYSSPYMLPSIIEKTEKKVIDPSDRDPLFEEAARLIVRHQQGSVSLIQRRLKVGYARAGRIVDELEAAGVVGPFDGSKARQVLIESESDLEAIL